MKFLGNLNIDKMQDFFGRAAAMYRPGGVQEYERNKALLERNSLLNRLTEMQVAEAAQKKKEAEERRLARDRIINNEFMNTAQGGMGPTVANASPANQGAMNAARAMPDQFLAAKARELWPNPMDYIVGSPSSGIARINPEGPPEMLMQPAWTPWQMATIGGGSTMGQPIQTTDASGNTIYQQPIMKRDGSVEYQPLPGVPASVAQSQRPVQTALVHRDTGEALRRQTDGQLIDINGDPVGAAYSVAASSFEKDRAAAQSLIAAQRKAEELKAKINANPAVFNKARQIGAKFGSKMTDWLVPGAAKAAIFNPEELQIISEVNAQAAEIIKEFYGAVLSLGEEQRANTFVVQEGEDLESILAKLDSGITMSQAKLPGMVPGAVKVARQTVYSDADELPYATPQEAEAAFKSNAIDRETFRQILTQMKARGL